MATRAGNTSLQTTPAFSQITPPSTWRRQCKPRGYGGRVVLLILTCSFIINISLITRLLMTQLNNDKLLWQFYLALMAFALVIPITSLLAEVAISRYKVFSYSIKAMWILSIIQCILSVIYYSNLATDIIATTLSNICIPAIIVYGAFGVSAVPLGVDQLTTGTNANISAFLMWGVWTIFCGEAVSITLHYFAQNILHHEESLVDVMLSLLCVVLLSLGLILDFFFGHKLVQEPVTVNPVTLIYKVLKYAAKHKNPVSRSAFTYCENEWPSRLDNGKAKYGGPFTTEQVEDVKTFWRIIPILFAVFMLLIPLQLQNLWYIPKNNEHKPNVFTGDMFVITLGIPVYELLVYPCLRNRGPTILQSTLIGAAALIVSSLFGLASETIQYLIFKTEQDRPHKLFTNIPSHVLLGFTNTIVLKTSLEFVCAQGPYNTKRILIGLSLTLYVLVTILNLLLYEGWRNKIRVLDRSRSGIWFYLTTLILTVLLFILLSWVIKRYKKRERDEIAGSQTMVEDIYYKYQEQEERCERSIQSD